MQPNMIVAAFGPCSIPHNASRVWADTAYRTKRDLKVSERRGLRERIQFRRAPRRGRSEQQAKANATRARIPAGPSMFSPPRNTA
jgi:IS5 family transposase